MQSSQDVMSQPFSIEGRLGPPEANRGRRIPESWSFLMYRFFYICRTGGPQWQCCTVIPSETWFPFHPVPLASSLKWYCVCCGAKYMRTFGMLIEIKVQGCWYYVKIDTPQHVNLHTSSWERAVMSSGDLRAMLNHVTPHKHSILRPITQADVFCEIRHSDHNAYKITPAVYESLPHFDWRGDV